MSAPKLGSFFRRCMSGLTQRCLEVEKHFRQKYIQVAIMGAESATGQMTSYLLKQNPVVSRLYLYGKDESYVESIADDLNLIDTKCVVKAYAGKRGLPRVLRRADVILIAGLDKCPADTDPVTVMRVEGRRVAEMAVACTMYAPKSVIIVAAPPVAGNTALVTEIFRQTHWYHPGRIIGSVALHQIRTNSVAARYQDLDPSSVHVPLIGGPDADCAVPLFSRATPIPLTPNDCESLTECLKNPKGVTLSKSAVPCHFEGYTMSESHALNQLVTTVGLGLCGDSRANCTAFVRQNFIKNCRFLVTTVKFGPGGIVHNYGLPYLTKYELDLLERATAIVRERDKLAEEMRCEFEVKDAFQVTALVSVPRPKFKKEKKRD